jgi:molybdenum cofactor guanylyltransferase
VGFRGSPPSRARLVPDRIAGCGPLGGLDAALTSARHPEVVLLACDMPFISAGFIASLLAAAPGFDAVVPKTERGYHPLCAVYTRGCVGAVEQALAEGRLAMTALLERIRVREVHGEEIDRFGPPQHVLANINTPAEFEELEALPGHKL